MKASKRSVSAPPAARRNAEAKAGEGGVGGGLDDAIYKLVAHGHGAGMFKRIISTGPGLVAGYLITLGVMQAVQARGLWPDLATDRVAPTADREVTS